MKLIRYLVFIFLCVAVKAQQVPSLYTVLTGNIQSVNGSSATAQCESTSSFFGAFSCADPSSSVPFDGDIPTLRGLGGNMWASQLLTVQSASASPLTAQSSTTSILIDFIAVSDYAGLRSIELVLFNCIQWGISVSNIRLEAGISNVVNIVPSEASCNSLVRLCQPVAVSSFQTQLRLVFATPNPLDWVHIAEIGFYSDNPNCLRTSTSTTFEIITAASPSTTDSEMTETASPPATVPESTTAATFTAKPIPSQYTVLTGNIQSVNGSSATARCEATASFFGAFSCADPSSSVPFDGDIPTLRGLGGNQWASQLLTVQSASASPLTAQSSTTSILIDFIATSDYAGLRSIELVLFNCIQWGISVSNIRLEAGISNVVNIVPSEASCNSLVRLCQPVEVSRFQTQLRLVFATPNPLDWVHIAEIGFYSDNPNCLHIPSTTASEFTTTAFPASELTTAVFPPTTASEFSIATTDPDSTPGKQQGDLRTTDDPTIQTTDDDVTTDIKADTTDHADDVIRTFRASNSFTTPLLATSVVAVAIAIVEFIAIVLLVLDRLKPKRKHEKASSLGEELNSNSTHETPSTVGGVREESDYEEVEDDHTYMEIAEEDTMEFKKDSTPITFQQNSVMKVQEDSMRRGRETTI